MYLFCKKFILRPSKYSMFISNIKQLRHSPIAIIIGLSIGIILTWITYYFSNFLMTQWNFWKLYAYSVIIFDIINILLTTIFMTATTRRRLHFGKKNINNSRWFIGSFFTTLISWCPSCSITLATYLGLSSIITILPRWGIELKILWTIILIYACYDTLKNMTSCKMR